MHTQQTYKKKQRDKSINNTPRWVALIDEIKYYL